MNSAPLTETHSGRHSLPYSAGIAGSPLIAEEVLRLLADVRDGKLSPEAAWPLLAVGAGVGQTPEVTIDLDRARRCGYPEVVFGPGKTVSAICDVFRAQHARQQPSLATRVTPEQAAGVCQVLPEIEYHPVARTLRWGTMPAQPGSGQVVVVSAGTSDLPVAQEAAETARWMGCEVDVVIDIGVAGPHRLLQQLPRLLVARVIVVVAGMEAALPSVVAGHVACPVIAVPTSQGYGAHFGGVTALLGAINSCAASVAAVNIDAGFKGGYLAGLIARPPITA